MKRRDFVQALAGGAALSTLAMERLNAAVYQDIKKLNRKFIRDNSPDGVYWRAVSVHFLFKDDLIMMNNGTLGPMPKPVLTSLMEGHRLQATNPFACYDYLPSKKAAVREKSPA